VVLRPPGRRTTARHELPRCSKDAMVPPEVGDTLWGHRGDSQAGAVGENMVLFGELSCPHAYAMDAKKPHKSMTCGAFYDIGLVPLAGFELATFSLRMNCSTN